MVRSALAAAALLLVSCGPHETTITLVFPEPGLDGTPVQDLVERIEIRAYEPNAVMGGVCGAVDDWNYRTCAGRSCSPADDPNLGVEPRGELIAVRADDGSLTVPPLDLGSGDIDSWQVVVIARLADEVIYGCSPVAREMDTVIELQFLLCSLRACDESYPAECLAEPDCILSADDPRHPVCTSEEGSGVDAWVDADGARCPGRPQVAGICRRGKVDCTTTPRATVVVPAVCPNLVDDERCDDGMRGYDPTQDLDCDLSHPPCAVEECANVGERGSCDRCGTRTCRDDHVWGPCRTPADICNGVNDDCDANVDEASDTLLEACSAVEGAVSASGCRAGVCVCGDGPQCPDGLTCCMTGDTHACVDTTRNGRHCGDCMSPCGPGQVCTDRGCVDAPDGGATLDAGSLDGGVGDGGATAGCGTVDDCNAFAQRADACQAGSCLCGGAAACRGTELCCRGRCVDAWSNPLACGACGRVCDSGICAGRQCR
ncbi:MAG: hypothetical protein AB7S26_03540 [Sandaracinaceae bacterium]